MEKVLAESRNYRVLHEWETVSLIRKSARKLFGLGTPKSEVIIGDFYGDPEVAIIDEKERFVIMGGCGLIIYWLEEPFEPYSGLESDQWTELLRKPKDIWSIESLVQETENLVRFTVDPYSEVAGTYHLSLPHLTIKKLQER